MATAIERDISLNQAAKLTGYSQGTLRPLWPAIPTAYVTEGGRYWVNPSGLQDWFYERSACAGAAVP